MAYPAGFSSDEDEFAGFISDDSADLEPVIQVAEEVQNNQDNAPQELTKEEKLSNLFFAVMNGNIQEVTVLLDQGIDVDADIRDGWTLILLAASVGDPNIVHELINRGANVNLSRDKYTPLMAACSCPESTAPFLKSLEVVTLLIAIGADTEAITHSRKTAFMFAASNGNVEIVKKLLPICKSKAEDNQGWNALFWAANDNQPAVVQVLLEAGFSPDKIDVRGHTPIFYAVSQEHENVIKLFPIQSDDTVTSTASDCTYDIEGLFRDLKSGEGPQFYRDLCCILYGMQSEQLMNKFRNISLLDFLSLYDAKLLALGVTIPYQRKRILTGLHKFHRHLYKQKSICKAAKDASYSTIDLGNELIAAIRQVIAMQASIRYISYGYEVDVKENESPQTSTAMYSILQIKKTAKNVNLVTQTWDAKIRPADLITKTPNKGTLRWVKWFACLSIATLTVVVARKLEKHN